ncbi:MULTISPECIES: hypothetical protein [unclassified Microcoleus]|uniref:hypothetical protein n=1 Tax=unclassified Microcoleus TaxID=2642155 RepID=UPI002FD6D030
MDCRKLTVNNSSFVLNDTAEASDLEMTARSEICLTDISENLQAFHVSRLWLFDTSFLIVKN